MTYQIDPAIEAEAAERDRVMAEVTFHVSGLRSYDARVAGRKVGEASKTGTHLDHYPWDWMVEFDVKRRPNGLPGKVTGSEETLRACKEAIRYAWLSREVAP